MPVYKDSLSTKDGSIWYFKCNYTVGAEHRQYKSKKYKTQREAKEAEAKFLLSTDKIANSAIDFSRLIQDYLEEQKSLVKPQTMPHLIKVCEHIEKPLGKVKVAKMSKGHYEAFRSYLDDTGFSANYKNKINTQLKALLKFAYKKYDIRNDIPEKYDAFSDSSVAKEKIDFFTLEEFNQFIDVIDDVRFQALFTTLFFMGLRIGEADALQVKDFKDGYLHIEKTVNTKIKGIAGKYLTTSPKTKSSNRNLPVPKRVADSLKTAIDYWKQDSNFNEDYYIFGGFNPLPETTITKAKNKYCELANVKQIRIHDFRHSCASLLINNGANVTLVSSWLGHSDVKMTLNTYSHLWKSKLEEIVIAIDNFN